MGEHSISQKTVGFMIDELMTTSMKCWFSQEEIMSETDVNKIADAAKRAQLLNARRNALIRAIDEYLGQSEISVTSKTYAK